MTTKQIIAAFERKEVEMGPNTVLNVGTAEKPEWMYYNWQGYPNHPGWIHAPGNSFRDAFQNFYEISLPVFKRELR